MSRLEIPSLVILLARISVVVSFCDFGSLPGFWDGDQYVLLNEECVLERYADNWTELQAAKDGDHLLLIGDSFDRELIQGVANRGRHKFYDYTPSVLDDNKPSKIGRNIQFSVGRQWVSNLFIFGANNEGLYPEASAAGHAEGMHNLTFSRICEDFRRYSSYSQVCPLVGGGGLQVPGRLANAQPPARLQLMDRLPFPNPET